MSRRCKVYGKDSKERFSILREAVINKSSWDFLLRFLGSSGASLIDQKWVLVETEDKNDACAT